LDQPVPEQHRRSARGVPPVPLIEDHQPQGRPRVRVQGFLRLTTPTSHCRPLPESLIVRLKRTVTCNHSGSELGEYQPLHLHSSGNRRQEQICQVPTNCLGFLRIEDLGNLGSSFLYKGATETPGLNISAKSFQISTIASSRRTSR